jgi:hypothetical protein
MTRQARFRQTDIARAFRGAIAGGITRPKIIIDPATGRITIVAGSADDDETANEWDEVTPQTPEQESK